MLEKLKCNNSPKMIVQKEYIASGVFKAVFQVRQSERRAVIDVVQLKLECRDEDILETKFIA